MPTINLQSKYVEDASGNKFAPITTPNAVRWSNGDDLDDKLAAKQAVIDSSNKLSASNVSGLATVATSGSYNDLSNTPTIPTVNNATLTIQKNGTQVATFTANASSNVTANITVPTGDLASVNKDGTSSTKYLRGDGTWQAFPTSLPANGGNAATVNSHTVNSDVPANAVFTDTTYSVMGASGSSHASGLVPDPGSTAGTTKFLREDGTWVVPTVDVSGKEDKMSSVLMYSESGPTSTLSPAINTLYGVSAASTLDVTLPTITDTTKVQSFVLILSFASSNPSITIHGTQTQDNLCLVAMPTDISFEQYKTYEINCMFWGQETTDQFIEGQTVTLNYWSVAIRYIGNTNL